MSFINDVAFDEKLAVLEIEGTLTVGGDILLQGAFPKMDQKLAALKKHHPSPYRMNYTDWIIHS